MSSVRSVVLIACATVCLSHAAPPPTCAVTEAPSPVFIPPPPYASWRLENGTFFSGSDDFWTILPSNGVWETQHDHATYDRGKIAWFSKGYWWLSRTEEDLVVDAWRLDGLGESVRVNGATNAFVRDIQVSAMLNSIEFPSTGCWEVSAHWHSHELNFVVWVTPYTASSK
jgi:hypothetical protein